MIMGEPLEGYLVRTKANNFKVLCAECLGKSEYEEIVRPWSVPITSHCVKCLRGVLLNPADYRPPAKG